jgi:3-isopropylmalate dehydrogenase
VEYNIAVLAGDGIGPEVTTQGTRLLEAVGARYAHNFRFTPGWIGGAAVDRDGTPLPDATVDLCLTSDAILLGAVGGPKWDGYAPALRPEAGLLGLRKALNVFANLRPIRVYPSLLESSSLKPQVVAGTDFVIVRELIGGLYFGRPRERRIGPQGLEVVDTLYYTQAEIAQVVTLAFELAMTRGKRLTSVDKANVLESSRLWRETVDHIHGTFPEVEVRHMLVDNAAMQLVKDPTQFDVVVTENLFGDILSDEAAMITGSIGMLPSASLSAQGPGLYEPVHGSAPDIAGLQVANPLATFASIALMLKHSLDLHEEAQSVEQAIAVVLADGYRTADLAGHGNPVSTEEMTSAVIRALE